MSFAASAAAAGSVSRPRSSSQLVLYHVGPRHYGPNPADSDTADAAGDFFFEMFEVISIPLACGDTDVCPGWNCPFECRNPEASDPDGVINKIVLKKLLLGILLKRI